MKRVKSFSLNQKLLDAIKKAGGTFSEEAKKRYSKGGYYHSDHFDDVPNRGGRTVDEVHFDDPIFDPIRGQHANFDIDFNEWFNRYGNPFNQTHFDFTGYKSPVTGERMDINHSECKQSLLTIIGWSGIWNSLNTPQKMKVFRFVYNAENATLINT